MRVAFTIALNALHHFEHNDFAGKMADMFDYWVIVEGAAQSHGSTSWCNEMPDKYHNNGMSIDGTAGYLDRLGHAYPNVYPILFQGPWDSKDVMVNAAVDALKILVEKENPDFENIFLWEVDADEQWEEIDILHSEHFIESVGCKTGEFHCDYFVGPALQTKGEWGEGKKLPYRRLWQWKGESFKTHEPPELEGGNGETILIPHRFKHYAYYFKQDVEFKNDWYTGHEGILDRWYAIQLKPHNEFPLPISELITGSWGQTDTQIVVV